VKEQRVGVYANPIRTLFIPLVEIVYIGCTYLEEVNPKNMTSNTSTIQENLS
jgi:hypothetical protein